jgi:hypothetical protein
VWKLGVRVSVVEGEGWKLTKVRSAGNSSRIYTSSKTDEEGVCGGVTGDGKESGKWEK